MPQISIPPSQGPSPGNRPLLVPPEERFWKRYSPHHEFQVSSGTSFALHVIILGLLVVVGIFWLNRHETPREAIEVGTTAPSLDNPVLGKPGNTDRNNGGPQVGKKQEEVSPSGKEGAFPRGPGEFRPEGIKDGSPLETPPGLPPILIPRKEQGNRFIPEGSALPNDLNDIRRSAKSALSQGPRGQGSDGHGGKDGSTGKDKRGKSSSGSLERLRAERQVRWRVIFNRTTDGADYRDKLRAMGAILIVAQKGKVDAKGRTSLTYPFAIYTQDIKKGAKLTPVTPADIKKFNRIFWIDDKQKSVKALAEALGVPTPPLFACFFPEKVEQECLKLERARYKGPEGNIKETVFHVEMKGDSYRLVCDRVTLY